MNIARIFSFSVYALALVPLGLNWELFAYVRDSGSFDSIGKPEQMRLIGGFVLTLVLWVVALRFVEPFVRQYNESVKEALIERERQKHNSRGVLDGPSAGNSLILAGGVFISCVFVVNVAALFVPEVITTPVKFVFDIPLVEKINVYNSSLGDRGFDTSYFVDKGAYYPFVFKPVSIIPASLLFIVIVLVASVLNALAKNSIIKSVTGQLSAQKPVGFFSVWFGIIRLPFSLTVIPFIIFWVLANDGYFRSDSMQQMLIGKNPIYHNFHHVLADQQQLDRAIYKPDYVHVFRANDGKHYALMLKVDAVEYQAFLFERGSYNLKKSDKAAFYSILDLAEGVVVKGGVFQNCDGSVLLLSSIENTYPANTGNNELHYLGSYFYHAYILNTETFNFCLKSRDEYLHAAGMGDMGVVNAKVSAVNDHTDGNTSSKTLVDSIEIVTASDERYRYTINGSILHSMSDPDYEPYRYRNESKYINNRVRVQKSRGSGNSTEVFRVMPNNGVPGNSWLPDEHRLIKADVLSHDDNGILISYLNQLGDDGIRAMSWLNKDNRLAWTYQYDGKNLPPKKLRNEIRYDLNDITDDAFIVEVGVGRVPLQYVSIDKESGNINWQYQMPAIN